MTISRRRQLRRQNTGNARRRRGETDPLTLGGLVLLGGLGAFLAVSSFNSPTARYERSVRATIKQEEADAVLAQLRAEEEARRLQDEIAEAHRRYVGKCTMLTSLNVDPNGYAFQAIAITANTPYIDPETGGFLPEGQIVCDDRLVTAIIGSGGVAEQFARATDGDLVNQRFADALGWHQQATRSTVGN
ncbi:MAG: hypothetical protein F6K42_12985 [Leptolyngbya sp. SIO1D8]|nr:hypothetical protein [Leptolyngbya sp. SIO1D8]